MDQLTGIHCVTLFKQSGSNYLLARVALMDNLLEGNLYLIKILQQYQLIEDEVLLFTNKNRINIHKLTTSNISDGIIFYENFNTHSFLTKDV